MMELAQMEDVHSFFYLAVNRLITDKMQNSFYLITEHSGSIRYSLNKQDWFF